MPDAGGMRRARRARLVLVTALALVVLIACGEALETEDGIVVSVDSPALGRVDSFQLLTPDGRTLTFDTSEMEFRSEFPVSHLSEHQLLSDPIAVTYREDGNRLVVTKLSDAS